MVSYLPWRMVLRDPLPTADAVTADAVNPEHAFDTLHLGTVWCHSADPNHQRAHMMQSIATAHAMVA